MKKVFSKIAGTFAIFVVVLFISLVVLQFIPYKQDNHLSSEIDIENVGQNWHLPVSVRYFTKMPGKYDEVSIAIELTSKEKLTVTARNLKYQGITFQAVDHDWTLTGVKFTDSTAKIVIPAGTVISQSGYKLEKDYVIMDLTIVTSAAEYFGVFFKHIYLNLIIAALVSLINLIPWRPVENLDFHKGIVQMALAIPCVIFGGGAMGLISDQLGRGSYQNDHTLIIMMSVFVIPLGIIALYAVLSTFVHNIGSCGIFAGIAISLVQLILVMTVIYAAGAVLVTLLVGAKSVMNTKREYY